MSSDMLEADSAMKNYKSPAGKMVQSFLDHTGLIKTENSLNAV